MGVEGIVRSESGKKREKKRTMGDKSREEQRITSLTSQRSKKEKKWTSVKSTNCTK